MPVSKHSSAIILFSLFFVHGCAAGLQEDLGEAGKFCIPESQVVPDVPYAPVDSPSAPKGFAFAGCWSSTGVPPAGCPMPGTVRGGVVSAKQHAAPVRWSELGRDPKGTYARVAANPKSKFEIHAEGSILVVENGRLWNEWFVWRKEKPNKLEAKIEEEDTLVVTCELVRGVHTPSSVVGRDMVSCRRTTHAGGYEVQYSFESVSRIPLDVESLDAAVVGAVDGWRCPR